MAVHTLEGPLDVGRLERAVEALQQYTSIFHRSFTRVGSRWATVVGDGAPPRLQVVDFSGRPDTAAADFANKIGSLILTLGRLFNLPALSLVLWKLSA